MAVQTENVPSLLTFEVRAKNRPPLDFLINLRKKKECSLLKSLALALKYMHARTKLAYLSGNVNILYRNFEIKVKATQRWERDSDTNLSICETT